MRPVRTLLDPCSARVLKFELRERNAEKIRLASDMRGLAVVMRQRIRELRAHHEAQRARLASTVKHTVALSGSIH